jgi:hypothetical protein
MVRVACQVELPGPVFRFRVADGVDVRLPGAHQLAGLGGVEPGHRLDEIGLMLQVEVEVAFADVGHDAVDLPAPQAAGLPRLRRHRHRRHLAGGGHHPSRGPVGEARLVAQPGVHRGRRVQLPPLGPIELGDPFVDQRLEPVAGSEELGQAQLLEPLPGGQHPSEAAPR